MVTGKGSCPFLGPPAALTITATRATAKKKSKIRVIEKRILGQRAGFQAAALLAGTGWATKRTPSAVQTRLMVSNRGALSGRRAL
jgi:hypothetical protein